MEGNELLKNGFDRLEIAYENVASFTKKHFVISLLTPALLVGVLLLQFESNHKLGTIIQGLVTAREVISQTKELPIRLVEPVKIDMDDVARNMQKVVPGFGTAPVDDPAVAPAANPRVVPVPRPKPKVVKPKPKPKIRKPKAPTWQQPCFGFFCGKENGGAVAPPR